MQVGPAFAATSAALSQVSHPAYEPAMAAPPDSPRRALFEEAVQAGAPPDVVTRWLAAAAAPQASPLAAHGAGRLANDVTALEEAPLDARSYLLGQRSALEFAFQEALPQRTGAFASRPAPHAVRRSGVAPARRAPGIIWRREPRGVDA